MKPSFCQVWKHIIDIDPKLARGQFDTFGILIDNVFIVDLARGRDVFLGNNTNATIMSNNRITWKDDLSGADHGRIDCTGFFLTYLLMKWRVTRPEILFAVNRQHRRCRHQSPVQ